jgi:hypothetical protein
MLLLGGSKALVILGLSEEDIITATTLFQLIPSPPPLCFQRSMTKNTSKHSIRCEFTKAEILMGYTLRQLQRAKALRVLGTSEDNLEIENSKNLGALGKSGRRRSFMVPSVLRKSHGESEPLMSKCI